MGKFTELTNLYSISKTLRFELKPVGNTQNMLVENKVFAEDQKKKEAYKNIKPYFDKLHREFVIEALTGIELLGLDTYQNYYREWKKDKKNAPVIKKIKESKKTLREQIVSYFDKTGKTWSTQTYKDLNLKNKDHTLLFEEKIFSVLKARYGNDPNTQLTLTEEDKKTKKTKDDTYSMFDVWKGFSGYFTKFHETRKNFYKSDGTTTALATRIIDQNLDRFLENIQILESLKEKINFEEVEHFFDKNVNTVFSVKFYNSCILQDGIDFYNYYLGGKTLKNGEKKKGVNELINEYRQKNPSDRIPFLKKLDKQILSEKENKILLIDSDEQCVEVLLEFQKNSELKFRLLQSLVTNVFDKKKRFSFSKIYISKEAFNTISRKWTNETRIFEEQLNTILIKEKAIKSTNVIDNQYSFPDFISLQYIHDALDSVVTKDKFWKEKYYHSELNKIAPITEKDTLWQGFLLILNFEFSTNFQTFYENSNKLKPVLGLDTFNIKKHKVLIKEFADSALNCYQLAKYFAIEKKRAWDVSYDVSDDFYSHNIYGYLLYYEDSYSQIVQAYNHIRNYLTKKPYSEEKWKLNFSNPHLAGGWDKNKESDCTSVLFRKDKQYYIGIMKKGCTKLFDARNEGKFLVNGSIGGYEKMEYKYFAVPSNMFPKVCFSKTGKEFFKPNQEILDIYENARFKKGENFSLKSLHTLINFYKQCLKDYEGWQHYDFSNVKATKEYTDNIGEFYADVSKAGYKVSFIPVSEEYINEKNNKGELYLFKIHNQDFADGKTGKKNLHTMYWEGLFSNENTKEFLLKLNGNAEIFFRPRSIDPVSEIRNFSREIIAKKRFTEDKIFFHCPITLNRCKDISSSINPTINAFLANNPEINILGVDRGEKHLAYFTVINQQQKVIATGTLNKVQNISHNGLPTHKNEKRIEKILDTTGKVIEYKVVQTGKKVEYEDYKMLLQAKQDNRRIQRQSWDNVENIKDLKKGYISQVVRKLADLAIKHNAIIVMEDLNMRFKQIRGGIEASIYQQLEKALIDKLSFLVDKNEINPEKAGHLLKAYQLAKPIENYKDMGKQTGIIFYTQASYTSKIDPVSGWRPNIYLKYTNAEKAKSDILKFKDIRFNQSKKRFEISYDIKNFVNNSKVPFPNKTEWTVCSSVERFKWDKKANHKNGEYVHYKDVTQEYISLFDNYNIDYLTADILVQINNLATEKNEKFFSKFITLFNLICQIRNTNPHTINENESDYIQSPIEPFFDSRIADTFGTNLPKNGDENGAFNIARKGIIILEKITKHTIANKEINKEINWQDLYISQKEWDDFITKQ